MWRYSPAMSGKPTVWEGDFNLSNEARAAAEPLLDDFFVAWIEERDYPSMMPTSTNLLAEMRERAEQDGGDTRSFDSINTDDTAMLDNLLLETVKNWETWLIGRHGDSVVSTVVIISNQRHYQEDG